MNIQSEPVVSLNNVAVLHPGIDRTFPATRFSAHASELIAVLSPDIHLARKYLRGMAAIEYPEQGEVVVMGLETRDLDRVAYKELRARIGYVIGDSTLLSIHSGLVNVMLPALYHHPEKTFSTVSMYARTLLKELECDFDAQLMPHNMTSFQQRQIQLARALILEPDILFMEDPFYELAIDDKRAFAQNIIKMRGRVHSNCVILTTDYLDFVKRYVDRLIFVGSCSVEVFPDWEQFSASRKPEIERYLDANL
jgi:ABC-type transporter Mla maintaining outer membrane lipid asymmetry ATPase subunit MlaF